MSADDGLQDSIERTRQAFRAAPDAPPLIPRSDNAPPLTLSHADGQAPVAASRSVPAGLHPFFRGLLDALPEPGTQWSQAQRDQWLETARHIFALIYTDPQNRAPDHPPASIQYDQYDRRVS